MGILRVIVFLVSFGGRFTRWQWWLVFTPSVLLLQIGYFLKGVETAGQVFNEDYPLRLGLAFLFLVWVSSAATVKRLHDMGVGGNIFEFLVLALFLLPPSWFIIDKQSYQSINESVGLLLFNLTLIVAAVIICGIAKGDDGDNAYGPAPLWRF